MLNAINIIGCTGLPGDGIESMQLYVRTVAGELISVELDPRGTVALLKAKIQDKRSRLVFAGKQLSNNDSVVVSYNLQPESTVQEVGIGLGGANMVASKILKRSDMVGQIQKRFKKKLEEQFEIDDNQHIETPKVRPCARQGGDYTRPCGLEEEA